jgi:hypothetical protein
MEHNLVQILISHFYSKTTIKPKVLVFLIRMVLLRIISCLSTNFDLCDLHSIAFTLTLPSAIGTQVFLTAALQRCRTRPL